MSSTQPVVYNYLKPKLPATHADVKGKKWNFAAFVLGFAVLAEMFATVYYFCRLTGQIDMIRQKLNYPGQCLQYMNSYIDDTGGSVMTNVDPLCDSWLENIRVLINQRLRSDAKNLIYKELEAQNATFVSPGKPAIHLIAQHRNKPPNYAPHYINHTDGHDILYWKDIKGFTVHQGAMKYHHIGITIPKDGIYYIYSQVHFQHVRKLDIQDQHYNLFLQYLYKMSTYYNGPILLTKAIFTKCWSKEARFDIYTSFQGALFELQQGDKLFIEVTNANTMDINEESTYFGGFMVF